MQSNPSQDDGIKLACNWCKYPRITQELWLRNKEGRDYLVCKRHLSPEQRRRMRDEAKKSNS